MDGPDRCPYWHVHSICCVLLLSSPSPIHLYTSLSTLIFSLYKYRKQFFKFEWGRLTMKVKETTNIAVTIGMGKISFEQCNELVCLDFCNLFSVKEEYYLCMKFWFSCFLFEHGYRHIYFVTCSAMKSNNEKPNIAYWRFVDSSYLPSQCYDFKWLLKLYSQVFVIS
jgi:hypothetical protein